MKHPPFHSWAWLAIVAIALGLSAPAVASPISWTAAHATPALGAVTVPRVAPGRAPALLESTPALDVSHAMLESNSAFDLTHAAVYGIQVRFEPTATDRVISIPNVVTVPVAAVPEPSTWLLIGTGLLGLLFLGYRSRWEFGTEPPTEAIHPAAV
ncbi:MAG TPA: PEP-CTERM sorting domain-containing protein [Terriglobales bacterium]|nr:PEP-CTERM sorting domain-containing protein [Terriglobales bacterium]